MIQILEPILAALTHSRMEGSMTRVFATSCLVLASLICASAATAQSRPAPSIRLGGSAGLIDLSDDETHLGRGPAIGGVVSKPIGGHAVIEGEVAGASHHRDAGYLTANGKPVFAVARAAFLFGERDQRTRAFASAGWHVIHSTGTFTMPALGPGPITPTSPRESRDWSLTKSGLEFGAGVEVRTAGPWTFRPEFRVSGTASESGFSPSSSGIEPPILSWRVGVSVLFDVR
jgi:hypothetical protein